MIHFLSSEISTEELRQHCPDTPSYFISHALNFCHEWLSGKEYFHIQTSGSTGPPKNIQLSRKQMLASAKQTTSFLHFEAGENMLVCLNTRFIGGLMQLVRGLETGMNIYIDEPGRNPLEKYTKEHHFQHVSMVPMQMQEALEKASEKIKVFKTILIGGTCIHPNLKEKLRPFNNRVYHTYGMTETCSNIALRLLSLHSMEEGFRVFEGIELKQDERACLMIKGDITENKWIHTNDLVEFNNDGSFIVIGRTDHIINSGGIKINPEELEQICADSLISLKRRYIFSALPDEVLGERLVLLLEGNPMDINPIKKNLEVILNRYHFPSELLFVKAFCETPTGKIDRAGTRRLLTA